MQLFQVFGSLTVCRGWLFNLSGSKITRIKLGEYFASKLSGLKMSLVCFRVDGESGKVQRGISALRSLKDAFQLLQGYGFCVHASNRFSSVFVLLNCIYQLETSSSGTDSYVFN